MENLTCVLCGVRFIIKDGFGIDSNDAYRQAVNEHKEHFKGDWHRYNLKRNILELPSITYDAFKEKVLQQKAKQKEPEKFSGHCSLCSKKFSSAKAFENHLKSKRHQDLEKNQNTKIEIKNDLPSVEGISGQIKASKDAGVKEKKTGNEENIFEQQLAEGDGDEELEEDEEWDEEGLGLEECLFCSDVSDTVNDNVKHMSVAHGFFIPDAEYVSDLEGLLNYLGEVVGSLHQCLWCNTHRFHDTLAVQMHMRDKGHCKMLHEPETLIEYADFYDYRKSYPDYKGDKETDEDGDEEVQPDILEQSGYQLVLPSGHTIGHRALMKYFRQKLRPERQLVLSRDSSAVSKVISQYKALGWTGTTGAAAERKAKDIQYFNRVQRRHFVRLGINGNRLQKHYRDQVFGF